MPCCNQEQNKKKPEEITQEEKDDVRDTEKQIEQQRNKKNEIIAASAKDNKVVHQLIDLALLQNGMLKGAALDAFCEAFGGSDKVKKVSQIEDLRKPSKTTVRNTLIFNIVTTA